MTEALPVPLSSAQLNELDSDDESFFCDALEEQPVPSDMDLGTSLRDTQVALNLFLNNKFDLAKQMMETWADRSMYHALGRATLLHVQAIMTFEADHIDRAMEAVKQACGVANRHRRQVYITEQVSKIIAGGLSSSTLTYSDEEMHAELCYAEALLVQSMLSFVQDESLVSFVKEEMHAELCYAEALLVQSMLSFVQDESLVSFVKGAIKIRQCYVSYRECTRILHEHLWSSKDELIREHFEAGVRIGIGAFNLLISLLPARVLKLLEFAGFSGDRIIQSRGLVQLHNVAGGLEHTLRAPFASMALLTFHTIVEFILGLGDCDIEGCTRLSQPLLNNYPEGSIVLFFAGRLAEVSGDIEQAIAYLKKSISSQLEYPLFHHFCHWELMFCHAFERRWALASDFAYKLYCESRWSPCCYAYLTAVFALADEKKAKQETDRMNHLFGQTPSLKQRIAGKSLPVEKYCVAKATLYGSKSRKLVLAHLEVLYLWNGFQILAHNQRLLKPILNDVNSVLETGDSQTGLALHKDDLALCLLLKGVCLKYLDSPFQAQQLFREVMNMEKSVSKNVHVVPSAILELALLRLKEDDLREAQKLASKVKTFKGYLMEHRVIFKLHALQRLIVTERKEAS